MKTAALLALLAALSGALPLACAQEGTAASAGPVPLPAHFLPAPLPEDAAKTWPCQAGPVRAEPGVDVAKARQDRLLGMLNAWGQHHLKFSGDRAGCTNWDAVVQAWQRLGGAAPTGSLSQADLARLAAEKIRTEPQFLAATEAWNAKRRPPEPTVDFETPDDPAATVLGLQLGQRIALPACPVEFTRPRDGFVQQACFTTFGSGDWRNPQTAGTMQVYFPRNEHPEWMDRAAEMNATGYAPSVLAGFRANRLINLQFKVDQRMRQIALEALTRKWGTPSSLSADGRHARWTLAAVEAEASCPQLGEQFKSLALTPPCTYTVWLRSAKATVDREQQDRQLKERERLLDSGRKL
ncbi:MAG TPA: hypothetical protein VGE36_21250 [Roseateles sp.]